MELVMENDYFKELRLSREFARQFEEYIKSLSVNVTPLPPELLEAYNNLKHHYQLEMERNLS